MKLNLELDTQSISQVIKELKRTQRLFANGTLIKDFIEDVCLFIIKRANYYLENADLGELVKLKIKNAWQYDITQNGAKITNTATAEKSVGGTVEKVPLAVLVEFGTGVVGKADPHPRAFAEGYEYNVPSPSKSPSGMWSFFTNETELDLPTSALLGHNYYNDIRGTGGEGGRRLFIMTSGVEGVMYAYNAVVDAKTQLADPNSELSLKWTQLLERYLG